MPSQFVNQLLAITNTEAIIIGDELPAFAFTGQFFIAEEAIANTENISDLSGAPVTSLLQGQCAKWFNNQWFKLNFRFTVETDSTAVLTREQVNAIVLARYTNDEKAIVARFTQDNINSIINEIELDEDEITFTAKHFDASEDVYNIAPVIREKIFEILATTGGMTHHSEVVGTAFLTSVATAKIPITLRQEANLGYEISSGDLTADPDRHFFYGTSVSIVAAGPRGRQLDFFIPQKRYGEGNLNESPLQQGSTTYNLKYRYFQDLVGQDALELSCQIVSGDPTTLDNRIDFTIYQDQVLVMEQEGVVGLDTQAVKSLINESLLGYVQTSVLNDYVRSSTYRIDQATIGSRLTDLANTKADQDDLTALRQQIDNLGSGLSPEDRRTIQTLLNKTLDLIYKGNEVWVTATDDNDITTTRGVVNEGVINSKTDWSSVYTIPSGTETSGQIFIRLEKDANPNDYQIVAGSEISNVGNFLRVPYIDSPTYDFYQEAITFTGNYAVGQTITLQHHGEVGHTLYVGGAPILEAAIADINDTLSVLSNSAVVLTGEDVPARDLGKVGDLYIRNNNSFYVKTNSTTWVFINHFLDHTVIRYLRQRWEKTNSGETVINGNDSATAAFDFEASSNLIGADLRPSALELKAELSIRFDTRITRSADDDGTLNLKIYNGNSVIQGQISVGHDPIIYDRDTTIENTTHNISGYFRVTEIPKSKLDFVFTTTGFQETTNITIPSFTVYVGEAEIIESPKNVLNLPQPRKGNLVYLMRDVSDNQEGLYYSFDGTVYERAYLQREPRDVLDYDNSRDRTVVATLPENYRGWHTLHVHVKDGGNDGSSGDGSNDDTFVFLTKDLSMDSFNSHGRPNTSVSWNKDTRVISGAGSRELLISVTLI